jgi:hypothetical protein
MIVSIEHNNFCQVQPFISNDTHCQRHTCQVSSVELSSEVMLAQRGYDAQLLGHRAIHKTAGDMHVGGDAVLGAVTTLTPTCTQAQGVQEQTNICICVRTLTKAVWLKAMQCVADVPLRVGHGGIGWCCLQADDGGRSALAN